MSEVSVPQHPTGLNKEANKFLQKLQGDKKAVNIDATGNILITGRPNSGVPELVEQITTDLKERNIAYQTIKVTDANSSIHASNAIKKAESVILIEDDYRLLLASGGKIGNAKNLIYITRHLDVKMPEYKVFNQHFAFSSQRNEDITGYPSPFAGIGSELNKGEFVSIMDSTLTDLDQTHFI